MSSRGFAVGLTETR